MILFIPRSAGAGGDRAAGIFFQRLAQTPSQVFQGDGILVDAFCDVAAGLLDDVLGDVGGEAQAQKAVNVAGDMQRSVCQFLIAQEPKPEKLRNVGVSTVVVVTLMVVVVLLLMMMMRGGEG
jgi:hypothetical protein